MNKMMMMAAKTYIPDTGAKYLHALSQLILKILIKVIITIYILPMRIWRIRQLVS